MKESLDRTSNRIDDGTSTSVSLISGSVGGAMQVLVGQPLDTIKTRSQIAPVRMFKGPLDVGIKTIKNEGFLGLYKGMFSPLIGIAGVNSLLFGAFTFSKRVVSPYPELTIAQTALAGSMAGAINSILASPVEMFKIRMQAQYGGSQDLLLRQVVYGMWNDWGFRKGIMRGFWITFVREIPAYAGFYSGFEATKRAFQRHYGTNNDLPNWTILTSGAVGGIGYWTFCYPLDVIKSRVQMADQPPKGINYISNTFRTVCKNEGAQALVRGLMPTCQVPAAAVTFLGYEISKKFLEKNTSL
ncbi:mitochondrial ornithine transporter 1 [Phakopsora pachyrhizi]|nr:mitochondrial ornithine transporter 1 [Phakopsora pachyrhizi]